MLEVRLLGGFSLTLDGRPVDSLRPGRAQSLLAYLLLHHQIPQSRARIAAEFWPDTSEAQARTNLRREIHALRRALPEGDYLLVQGQVLQWRGTSAWSCDLVRFRSAATVEEALAAYGGDLLPGCQEEWLLPHRDRLQAEFCRLLERCAEEREARGDHLGAIEVLRRLLALEPLREDLYRQMIAICARAGDRARAAAVFRECEEVLDRELGLEPSAETVDFWQQIVASAAVVATAPTARTELSSAGEGLPLIGRDKELQVAFRWLDSGLREGGEEILLITGEPGIGKTRLLEELQAEMRRRGGETVSGRGFEAERIRAYGPWLDAFKSADLLQAIDSSDRSQLFDPVVAHLRAFGASHAGLLLVFDDLHWFDDASLALLHYVARVLSGSRILLAGSARSTELSASPAQRCLRSLGLDGRLRKMALAPLTEDQVARLVVCVNPELDPGTGSGSGGNPLFAVEMARAARGDSSLDELLRARLECLDPQARELVCWGAVLGRSFTLNTLSQVSARPLAELLEAVEVLEQQALWRPRGEVYDFAHDVVREAAYECLSIPRRRLLHLQAARRLQGASEVARHATLGGEPELACRSYLEAAQQSLQVLAFTEAAELARLGLQQCVPGESPALRLELIRTAITVGMPRQELLALEGEVSALTQKAARRGIPEEEALASLVQSVLAYHLQNPDKLAAASLRTVEKSRYTDLATAARLVAHSGSCLACIGRDMPRAEAVALEARELSERAGLDLPDVYHALGLSYRFSGELERARENLERALTLSRERTPWQTCICLTHLACLLLEIREFPQVLNLVEELREVASPLGDESELAYADLLETLAREQDPLSSLARLRRLDAKQMLAFGHRYHAQNLLRQGELQAATEHAQVAWAAAETLQISDEQALAVAVLTEACLLRGDRQGAAHWLRRIRRLERHQVGGRAQAALHRAVRKRGSEKDGEHRSRNELASTLEPGRA